MAPSELRGQAKVIVTHVSIIQQHRKVEERARSSNGNSNSVDYYEGMWGTGREQDQQERCMKLPPSCYTLLKR